MAREMHDEGVRIACCWIGIRERRDVRQRWQIILTVALCRNNKSDKDDCKSPRFNSIVVTEDS